MGTAPGSQTRSVTWDYFALFPSLLSVIVQISVLSVFILSVVSISENRNTEPTNDQMELTESTEDLKKVEGGPEKENSEVVEFKVVYNKKK